MFPVGASVLFCKPSTPWSLEIHEIQLYYCAGSRGKEHDSRSLQCTELVLPPAREPMRKKWPSRVSSEEEEEGKICEKINKSILNLFEF